MQDVITFNIQIQPGDGPCTLPCIHRRDEKVLDMQLLALEFMAAKEREQVRKDEKKKPPASSSFQRSGLGC